ncbi:hypothetical protein BHE90_017495, partial [Fusarium euwallaceae]
IFAFLEHKIDFRLLWNEGIVVGCEKLLDYGRRSRGGRGGHGGAAITRDTFGIGFVKIARVRC